MGCKGINLKKDRRYMLRMAKRFVSVTGEPVQFYYTEVLGDKVYDFGPVSATRENVIKIISK